MPLLFQRPYGLENRPIPDSGIRALLDHARSPPPAITGHRRQAAALHPARLPARSSPPTRSCNGMPPHIAQLIAGHRDINTTMGYKAVYPQEAINGHRAFIARRRANCAPARNTAPPPTPNGKSSSASLLTAPHLDRRPGAQPGPLRG